MECAAYPSAVRFKARHGAQVHLLAALDQAGKQGIVLLELSGTQGMGIQTGRTFKHLACAVAHHHERGDTDAVDGQRGKQVLEQKVILRLVQQRCCALFAVFGTEPGEGINRDRSDDFSRPGPGTDQ